MSTKINIEEINRSAMSRALDVDLAHVSRILSGQRTPSLGLAKKMAEYLGVTLDDLTAKLEEIREKATKDEAEGGAEDETVPATT